VGRETFLAIKGDCMRLALLGYDDDALALVDWACSEGGHTLAAAYETGPGLTRRLAAAPEAGQTSDAWESLLVRMTWI
jgi:hypothetical protein